MVSLSHPVDTKYQEGMVTVVGYIEKIQVKEDKTTFTVVTDEKVLAVLYEEELSYQLGDKVRITGIIKPPSSNRNFHVFSYQNYLKSLKINWVIEIQTIDKLSVSTNFLYRIKNNVIRKVNCYDRAEYYQAFLLGDTTNFDPDIKKSYQENGISHVFAVSGMHISLLAGVLLYVLQFVLKNKNFSYIIIIIMLCFYLFLTGYTPSVVRATLFFIFLFLNRYLGLNLSILKIFLLIMYLSLFANPFLVYHTGFLFSYLVSLFLILFGKETKKMKSYFGKTLWISMIAFLAGFPILCNQYFIVNFLSPFLNVIIVPFVSLLVFPMAFISFLFPFTQSIFSSLVTCLEELTLLFSKITFLKFSFSYLGKLGMLLYYVGIFFFLKAIIQKNYKVIPIVGLVVVLHYHSAFFRTNYSIHFLDVGQGDATLITVPHKEWGILVDTGGKLSFDGKSDFFIAENIIVPRMYALGIKKIRYLVLTHGDADHVLESIPLLEKELVECVIMNEGNDNALEKEIKFTASEHNIPVISLSQEKMLLDGIEFYFLNPKNQVEENNDSLIVYTQLQNKHILLLGDATKENENMVIKMYDLPKMDIIKLGHHGSKTSTSDILLSELQPKYVTISAGINNRYGHPNKEVIESLHQRNIPYYVTSENGEIIFTLKDFISIVTCFP